MVHTLRTNYGNTLPFPEDRAVPLASIRRVLIVIPQLIGDAVLSSVLFSTLKYYLPHCEIDALAWDHTREIFLHHPDVTLVHTVNRQWRKKGVLRTLKPRLCLLRSMHARHYDLLIQPQHTTDGSWGSALIQILRIRYGAGAPASAHKSIMKRFFWRRSFTHCPTKAHDREGPRHVIETYLDLLRCLGIYPETHKRTVTFSPGSDAYTHTDALLKQHNLKKKGYILFAPTASSSGKTLSPTMCHEVLTALSAKGLRVVVTATPNIRESTFIEHLQLAEIPGVVNLSGRLNLSQLGAIAAQAECFVGVDSGTMHIAAAVGTPVVACFGPGDDIIFKPWQITHRIIAAPFTCRPCYRNGCGDGGVADCLMALTAKDILDAMQELLREVTKT